ncbi:putative 60S ribosomal protein L20 [Talaromyces proteolyticus]|uniref:60S ribosomal protein L20 n=1 Tax=Talaromyces proteolyticus TaxID=1131652 RepID=A0AAD4KGF7_9EURO|nr:putative 60S ribosomal protein L20 [Talaromyces proteolyticus]KAH8688886.1 putative 60S ribosomal protein L20 [Talaromyces proteolyticus]
MRTMLVPIRRPLVSLPFLLPSWSETGTVVGRRYQSSYQRTKRRLRIKPDASFRPSDEPHDQIIFNPPSSAPTVFHTPSKFLPEGDVRKTLTTPLLSNDITPENLASATTKSQEKKYHLTKEDVMEIQKLRVQDPVTWSKWKLARRFECSPNFIHMVCQGIPQKYELQKKVLEAVTSRWGAKRRMAREDRQLRKEAWARDE